MKSKRRFVRHVTALEAMTDRELVHIRFFNIGPAGYQVQPGDGQRATELLRERGFYRFDADRGTWVVNNRPRVP
jgi:hypothetical protein